MRSGSFFLGILVGVILTLLVLVLVLPNIGVFDMSASGPPGLLDWWGGTNLDHVVEKRAPAAKIPSSANPDEGFEHYAGVCVHCHGAPGAKREEWANRMLPTPPELWKTDTQEMTDGELYYIIDKGIRMSGMPSFGNARSEAEIWNMVALIRRLDKLSPVQVERLNHSVGEQANWNGEGGGQMEQQGQPASKGQPESQGQQ